jgi:hypothetical protein
MLPELGGYLSLGAQEKKLFIKALGRRAALDITKRGIMLNRFGLGGRSYANEGARDDLTDEFVNTGAVSLSGDDCKNAVRACFSAQIDDSAEFKESSDGSDVKILEAGSKRDTIIDWKLLGRALQFVRRTHDEREMYLEDRTLYNTSGDVAKHGEFKYSAGNLRQNVHNAGNRFTRFLGRRVADRVKDQIPTPILMAVRAAMPIKYANKLSKLDFLASEDESVLDSLKGYTDTAADVADSAVETAADIPKLPEAVTSHLQFLGAAQESVAGFTAGIADAVGDTVSNITENWGNISTTYDAISTLYTAARTIYENRKANKDADAAKEDDKRRLETSAAERSELSATEKSLLEKGLARNDKAASMGQGMATNRKVDEIVNATSSIVGSLAEDAAGSVLEKLPIAAIVEEAGHFINFVRGYFEDKKTVAQYFNSQAEAEKLKTRLKTTEGLQLNADDLKSIEGYSDDDMMRRGMGYEDYTEMASVVGLSITRSLLFSVGKQGPMKANRVRAIAVLVMLDCEDLVGQHDAESAEKLYSAIMASDYR